MRLFSSKRNYVLSVLMSLILVAACGGCQSSQITESMTVSEMIETSTEVTVVENSESASGFSNAEMETFLKDFFVQTENSELMEVLRAVKDSENSEEVSELTQQILDEMYGDTFDDIREHTFLYSNHYGFCTMYQMAIAYESDILVDEMDFNGDPASGYSWEVRYRLSAEEAAEPYQAKGFLNLDEDGKICSFSWSTGNPDFDGMSAGESAVKQVLIAILECPNEKLTPAMTYIALDESAPADAAEQEENKKKETEAWKEAVGDCFQEENFTWFMEHYNGRTDFQTLAEFYSLSISVVNIEAWELSPQTEKANASQRFTATICLSNEAGEEKECVTRWMVKYDTENPELLYTVEMEDDGGVLELAEGMQK